MFSNPQNAREITCPQAHALIQTNNLSHLEQSRFLASAENQYFCDVCRHNIYPQVAPCYHCTTCGFDLCPTCYEAQKSVQIACPQDHPLFLVPDLQQFSNYETNDYFCNLCKKNLNSASNPAAHCRTCGYDLCQACLAKYRNSMSSLLSMNNNLNLHLLSKNLERLRAANEIGPKRSTCPKLHFLTPVNDYKRVYNNVTGSYAENKYFCDTCRVDYDCTVNNSFHCSACGFDLCPKCEEKAQKINFACPQGHMLFIVSALNAMHEATGAYEHNNYVCNSCKVGYNAGFHPSCHCKECGYDLCPSCFETRNKEIGHQNQQVEAQQKMQVENIPVSVPGEKKDENEEILCVLCLNNKRSYLFNPCNHLCACGDCSADILRRGTGCPICRSQIQSSTKVFMS